jgi:hypothetical protein
MLSFALVTVTEESLRYLALVVVAVTNTSFVT